METIDQDTDNMIAGIAFHWYSGDHFEALQLAHERYLDKKLLFSEGCVEYSKFVGKDQLADARMYGHDIAGDLNGGACAFMDWCMLLDARGGPNHVDNFVDAPIMYDAETDNMERKLSYYYIGHFSRAIVPGSVRIGFSRYTDKLDVIMTVWIDCGAERTDNHENRQRAGARGGKADGEERQKDKIRQHSV